jgi:hypothetical protein
MGFRRELVDEVLEAGTIVLMWRPGRRETAARAFCGLIGRSLIAVSGGTRRWSKRDSDCEQHGRGAPERRLR